VDLGRGNFSSADLHRGPWATTGELVDRQLCSPATDAIRALNAEALIDSRLDLFCAAKGPYAQSSISAAPRCMRPIHDSGPPPRGPIAGVARTVRTRPSIVRAVRWMRCSGGRCCRGLRRRTRSIG